MEIFNSVKEKVEPWANSMIMMTQTPPKSMLDFYNVFNVEYQNKVEGIFKNDLRLCYLWIQYSEYNRIKLSDIEHLDLNNLKQKFQNIKSGDIPFEGYENHLRNAIAHLTYSYNKLSETMEYRDEKAGWVKEYNSFELMQLSEKLMIFNFLMTFYMGILFTYDITFCPTRHLSKNIKDFHPEKI